MAALLPRPRGSAPRGFLALAFAFALAAAPRAARAQLVAPGEPLLVARTERFDIYYPPALSAEADRLASFADATYDRLARRFPDGARSSRRVPVILSDRSASPNGSYTPYPSARIVLEVAPASLADELGSNDDDLRNLFSHELTHALSLGTRSPFWAFAAAAFGDLVEPCGWTAAPSLIEGSAVASEGAPIPGGLSGRARDPLSFSLVEQDLLQGRPKGFWQAAGAWDDYPYGQLRYLYGGLFCDRLIARYGEERFAELWRRLGEGDLFAGLEGGLVRKGAFEATYGMKLDAAWADFLEATALREPVVMATRRLSAKPGYLTALAAGSSGLYWADAARGAIMVLRPGEAEARRLLAADGSVDRLDLSPDGARLLLSARRVPAAGGEERFALVVDAASGKATGESWSGLREAAFAGDAIVGIADEGFRADLVLLRGGERRVLLAGGPSRSYGSPASLDGETVYCLAKDGGRVLALRVDAATGRACALSPGLPLDHLRSLSLSRDPEGRALLALSFASERSLYRLALVEDSGEVEARLRRQEALLSGSVLSPAAADGAVYYVGRFSEGEYPCAYPSDNPALALREAPASWAELDPSFSAPAKAPAAPAAAREKAPALPLALRVLRLPSISTDLNSAGAILLGADIAERLAWSLDARYDWAAGGADLGLYLGLGLDPWSASLSLSDGFREKSSGEGRASAASLSLSRAWRSFPSRRKLALSLLGEAAATAPVQAGSAYGAAYDYAAAAARAALAYSDYRTGYSPPFASRGWGADLSADAEWPLAPAAQERPAFSLEAGADCALDFLGLAASLRIAASPDGSVAFGPAERALAAAGGAESILAARAGSYYEYSALPASGDIYAFAQASTSPFDIEIQARPALGRLRSPLYFNRLTFEAGLRGAAYGASLAAPGAATLLSSAYCRLALTGTPLVGAAALAHATAGLEFSWAFRDDLVASPARLAFLAGLSL